MFAIGYKHYDKTVINTRFLEEKMYSFNIRKSVLRLILPVLIITLILPMDVMAKRRGALLIVSTSDQQLISGRLLAVDVEGLSLTIQKPDNTGRRVYVKDIHAIEIKRKFNLGIPGKGAAVGFGVGAGIAAVAYYDSDGEALLPWWGAIIVSGIWFAFMGAIIHTLASLTKSGYYKKIYMKNKTPAQIKKVLKKLRKKACLRAAHG